ncbi:hypothetical protein K437DRAFT_253202 [Tilletiaria anomala UBC 951]|uniref:Uncharacterized protein n=1 Tax=Tilletiaria anomala (strain ATCC 24038 / CBS 436.72 / UBC 951) TaxID=1037660 RepID=A0A066WQA4_TILAU|nr:uncharacterized protein K437DRAFT_253202 [Tilletiaria anomala UBC 951]KDN53189.1 hypothetical protein K437DRAFT_253202 [Tilletiaria anomala UBC 951]
MFSKAPRKGPFSPPADTPGPNTYDPQPENTNKYKRGAMFDSDARMKYSQGKQLAPDSIETLPLGKSAKENTLTVKSIQNRSSDANKLQERLTKAEAKVECLQREKTTLTNEKTNIITDLRLSNQRAEKLKAQLEKSEEKAAAFRDKASKSTVDDVTARDRLNTLVRLHEESKQHQAEELARGQRQFAERKAAHKTREEASKQEVASLRAELAHQQELAQKEAKDLALGYSGAVAEANILRRALSKAEQVQLEQQRQIYDLEGTLSAARAQLSEDMERLGQEHEYLAEENEHLRQDLHDQELAMTLEVGEKVEAEVELAQLRHNLCVMQDVVLATVAEVHHMERVLEATTLENDGLVVQNSLLVQRFKEQEAKVQQLCAASDQAQNNQRVDYAILASLQADIDTLLQLRHDDSNLPAQLHLDAEGIEQERAEWREERKTLAFALDLARRESDVLRVENIRMLALMEDVRCRVTDNATAKLLAEKELSALRSEADELRKGASARDKEVLTLRKERNGFDDQLHQLQKYEWEDQAELRELRDELKTVTEELESAKGHIKAIIRNLGHAKAKEEHLQKQNLVLEEALDSAVKYERAYEALQVEAQALISRNALAEEEAAALSAINAELVGHTNPFQKVHHISKIRRELDECKQQLIAAYIERDEAVKQHQLLADQLAMFRSLDMPLNLRPATNLTRVQRPPPSSAPDLSTLRLANSTASSQGAPTARRSAAPLKASRASLIRPSRLAVSQVGSVSTAQRARKSIQHLHVRRVHIPYEGEDGPELFHEDQWKDEEMTLQELGWRNA